MTTFKEPKANEWVQPVRRDYKLACCDCGLVHDMDFRVFRGRVQFRVRRNNRSTAMIRRHKGLRKMKDGSYELADSSAPRPTTEETTDGEI